MVGWIKSLRVTGCPGFLGHPQLYLLPGHIINSTLLHSQNVLVLDEKLQSPYLYPLSWDPILSTHSIQSSSNQTSVYFLFIYF